MAPLACQQRPRASAAVAEKWPAVVTLPKSGASDPIASEKAPPPPENGGGYRVTDHVKRYYKTTLI